MCDKKPLFEDLCLGCGKHLRTWMSKKHSLCGMCYSHAKVPYPVGFGNDFESKYVGVTTRRPLRVRVNDMMRWESMRNAAD